MNEWKHLFSLVVCEPGFLQVSNVQPTMFSVLRNGYQRRYLTYCAFTTLNLLACAYTMLNLLAEA